MAVLPVQISVIDPIFSIAIRSLTKRCSFLRVSTDHAIAIDKDSGRPSGTATIITAMAIVKLSRIFSRVS